MLSVPYAAQERTLAGLQEGLAGKLLLTVVVPLGEKAGPRLASAPAACRRLRKPASSWATALAWSPLSRTSRRIT